jgi:4'-phosphopantetheinyl transferase EntD
MAHSDQVMTFNAESLQVLFPDGVHAHCCRIADCDAALLPEEEPAVAKAIEKRRREFAAGRWCARRALQSLGCAPVPLPPEKGRMPRWPAGTLGTIAHNHVWSGAAVVRDDRFDGIGLDIETIGRVTDNIARYILTDTESRMLASMPADRSAWFMCLVFCAKEAVYKCVSRRVAFSMSFQDAVVAPGKDEGCFAVRMSDRVVSCLPAAALLMGTWREYAGDIFAGIVLPKAFL